MNTIIATDRAPAALGPYSQAVLSGKTLYLSGQLGINPETGMLAETAREQAAQALANLKAVLEQAGAGPERVTKTTVFLVDMQDFPAVNEAYAGLFGTDSPARSCVAVAALPKGALVEIDAIAEL